MINSPASYSQGCRFKTLPIGHLSLLMFCDFPQIIQLNALKCLMNSYYHMLWHLPTHRLTIWCNITLTIRIGLS